ncbi:MAG TPA: MFS transporter [Chloroflexota bacterium]|nr:MFS transporter [Chloroflexota bacterium]
MQYDRRAVTAAAVLLCAGAVNAALSNNVVTVAFPIFAEEFHTSPAVVVWIAIAFTLTNASLTTTFGRLSDMHGRRNFYSLGIAVFLTGSILCSTSGGIVQLIVFRVIQGVGSALVNANSMVYLVEIYPANRRGFVVGLWEACIGVGIAVGPILGGGLLSIFGWRSVFFVSIPVAVTILALVPRYMFEPNRPRHKQQFDFLGSGFFTAAVATLMFAITEGHDFGWSSPPVLGCFGFFVLCGAGFIYTELHTAQPMINLSMFRDWTFSAGNVAKIFAYLPFSAHSFLLPFYLEQAMGLTPATVGLSLTPLPVGMVATSLIAGPLSDRIGTRKLAPVGCAVQVVAAVLLTQVRPENGVGRLLLAQLLAGLGMGAFIAPNDSSILSATPHDRIGVANGIMAISRQLGIVSGYSVAGGLLAARLAANAGQFVPSFHQVYVVLAGIAFVGIFFAAARGALPLPLGEGRGEGMPVSQPSVAR